MTKASFEFEFNPGDTAEKVLALKQVDFSANIPGQFTVPGYCGDDETTITWNNELLQTFINVFHYFGERGILWRYLDVEFFASQRTFIEPLLHTAFSLNLFRHVRIGLKESYGLNNRHENEYEHDQTGDLLSGITLN